MLEPKKTPVQHDAVDEPEPESRVRIKPQPPTREAVRRAVADAIRDSAHEAIQQLIAEADSNHLSREEIIDRVVAIGIENAKGLLSEEDRVLFAREARNFFLEDPRFR
jgi:hypothetical protein